VAPHTSCNCRSFPLRIKRIRSAAFFEGALRKAIHAYKYKSAGSLTKVLVDLLVECLTWDPLDFDEIVPVPLHKARERERGYNQAELLARALAARTGKPFVARLERVRATSDQIGLDIASRHANVRDAFKLRAGASRPGRVLLIDDVCTTGATLDACAVALQAEGATTTYGLTVARPR
jgi:ComF family protein